MHFLHDLHKTAPIPAPGHSSESISGVHPRVAQDLEDLRRRVDALTLACQSLWEVLRAHTGMSDEVILRKMQEVDLRDGKADGRMSPKPVSCSQCGRINQNARSACLYCGGALPAPQVFQPA